MPSLSMATTPIINFFENNTCLVETLGPKIIQQLSTAIDKHTHATLVVSGGSTPKSLFQYLSVQPIDWNKVTITLADERCLPQDHEGSNARLLRENLLINKAAKATFLPLYESDETPSIAAINASRLLDDLDLYDVVILGMGTDGHTASLFPEASNLKEALAADAPACMAIDPITNNIMRITQSKSRLLQARNIYFHLVGQNKIDTLNRVIADKTKDTYPAAHFIHQNDVPVNIYFAAHK